MASIPDPPSSGEAASPAEERGTYDVGVVLREGWAGTIREGRYRRTGRRVSVQDIRPELVATPGLVERLADAGRRAATLRDPHLLAVYDLAEDGRALHLIAEWSDAPTLTAWLRGRDLRSEDAVSVIDGVLGGLAALHEAGLFHGRVSAETVVIDQGVQARLAELAACSVAAPPGSGPHSDVRAASRLGLDLLRGAGRRLDPAKRVLRAALDDPATMDAAALRQAVAVAATRAFGDGWRERVPAPRRRSRRILLVAAGLVIAGAGTAAAIVLLGGHATTVATPSAPLSLGNDATLAVTPVSGGCNTTFVFVARGSLRGTGTLVYRWQQSDGQSSAPTSLVITADKGAFQLTQAWRLQGAQALDGTMALQIIMPRNLTLTRSFHYACT